VDKVVDKKAQTTRITVDHLGYLVSRRTVEETIDPSELVNPARSAVRENAHDHEIERIERQNDSGRTLYQVRLVGDDLKIVRISESGEVVKQ
jgi:hypothetical protein